MPFAFYVTIPGVEEESSTPTRIVIASSLKQDVLDNPKHPATAEDVFVVHCSPQAIFRVRPATRCSSTLSGMPPIGILCSRLFNASRRPQLRYPLRGVFPDREPPSHGIGRYALPTVGPRHRNPLACALGTQGVGPLRRVGGTRAETCYRWT